MSFFGSIPRLLFGSANERRIKGFHSKVKAINALEAELAVLSDEALRQRTVDFREQVAAGRSLDELLVPAFATVREASKRTLGQRHFDVQLIGGMVLHEGSIAEMKTGEGKTLVATLACYLNALADKGVHVVTVNDYLAKRDSEWMGQIYRFLGLSVGVIVHGLDDDQRRAAYAADITYGTNNEFGFDYLRDNMKGELRAMVQRGHNYAIVDEVDSILIDEARTPLIISGPLDDRSELYTAIDEIVPLLTAGDYEVDEKQRTVNFTEAGNERLDDVLRERGLMKEGTLYDIENVTIVHHLQQALRAHKLFQLDKDYIVKDGEVVIVDEFTGRMMPGRRYSESLHQALEAKEHVQIQPENQTFASITFQNYFRMYGKLAGMTGTAATEADEFADIYKLDVVEVPTNVQIQRIDDDDEVYRTAAEKQKAIIALIKDCNQRGQPILVGTTSIEKSEVLAEALKKAKVPHQVLNARFHEQEAMIISQAGVPGAVTIATNMAGRGTDIQLGGNADMRVKADLADMPEGEERKIKEALIRAEIAALKAKALAAGGLFVLGTERHESRRIDNQLRGRSGRQGDPGHSKFFLSLQDDLMRIFGSDRMDGMLVKLGLKEDEAITHPWINRALEKAQQKVEARNFDIRKNLLKFDDVMNDQRKVIFEQRIELMADQDINETVSGMRRETVEELVKKHIPEKAYPEQWDSEGLHEQVRTMLNLDVPVSDWAKEEGIAGEEVFDRIIKAADETANTKISRWGVELMTQIEKTVLLQTIDRLWREHLVTLDHLRQVVGYRGYAQRDPLNEYKTESFELFQSMLARLREEVTRTMMAVEIVQRPPEPDSQSLPQFPPFSPPLAPVAALEGLQPSHINPLTGEDEMAEPGDTATRRGAARLLSAAALAVDPNDASTWGKVARNAPCPCGSGKKYKHCHGQFTA